MPRHAKPMPGTRTAPKFEVQGIGVGVGDGVGAGVALGTQLCALGN
ncbi:hypothetical protein CGRA01v4_01375 [Colletotrichum graminicola]|nr:hypothetical protein CGRA01v4_01375 [Colletotrichum graminicola]